MVSVDCKINEFCNKCNKIVTKRLVKEKRCKSNYYACSICLERNSVRHRKKKWQAYLAQKANARKKQGSEKLFESDIEELFNKQEGKCVLSGIRFDIESKWNRPSLDRIDNSKGYTKDNIQLVTWIVNHTRGELSVSEYLEICKLVSKEKNENN